MGNEAGMLASRQKVGGSVAEKSDCSNADVGISEIDMGVWLPGALLGWKRRLTLVGYQRVHGNVSKCQKWVGEHQSTVSR